MPKTLALIAAVLLLSGPAAASEAVLRALKEVDWRPAASLPLGAEYHLLREDPKTGGVQALVRMPKGYALPAHTHDVDETLIVLKGKVRIRSAGSDKTLGEGGYAVLPAGVSHELSAEGRKTVFLMVTSGPYGFKPPR